MIDRPFLIISIVTAILIVLAGACVSTVYGQSASTWLWLPWLECANCARPITPVPTVTLAPTATVTPEPTGTLFVVTATVTP